MFALWRAAAPSRDARDAASQRNGMASAKGPTIIGRKSGRLASRVERGTSRNCYRIGGKAGKMPPIRHPRGIDSFNMHAVEGDGHRLDCRMMRSC